MFKDSTQYKRLSTARFNAWWERTRLIASIVYCCVVIVVLLYVVPTTVLNAILTVIIAVPIYLWVVWDEEGSLARLYVHFVLKSVWRKAFGKWSISRWRRQEIFDERMTATLERFANALKAKASVSYTQDADLTNQKNEIDALFLVGRVAGMRETSLRSRFEKLVPTKFILLICTLLVSIVITFTACKSERPTGKIRRGNPTITCINKTGDTLLLKLFYGPHRKLWGLGDINSYAPPLVPPYDSLKFVDEYGIGEILAYNKSMNLGGDAGLVCGYLFNQVTADTILVFNYRMDQVLLSIKLPVRIQLVPPIEPFDSKGFSIARSPNAVSFSYGDSAYFEWQRNLYSNRGWTGPIKGINTIQIMPAGDSTSVIMVVNQQQRILKEMLWGVRIFAWYGGVRSLRWTPENEGWEEVKSSQQIASLLWKILHERNLL